MSRKGHGFSKGRGNGKNAIKRAQAWISKNKVRKMPVKPVEAKPEERRPE